MASGVVRAMTDNSGRINGGIKLNTTMVVTVIAVIGQLICGIIWLTNLGASVSQLQQSRADFRAYVHENFADLESKIEKIDKDGSRALARIEDRQNTVLQRLGILENKVNISPH